MQERSDDYKKKIAELMDAEAEEIEREILADPEISTLKADDSVKAKIDEQIEAYEYEKLISQLPEEYQEDFRLGRKTREEQKAKEKRKKAAVWKRLGAAAAVVVLVAGVGITSVGGPKRLVEFMQTTFGGREIDKVASSTEEENVLPLTESEEEQAYQQIRDELGIEPVKLIKNSEDMYFKSVEIDSYLKTAIMIYANEDRNISYVIQCLYTDGAWGMDTEDQLLDEYPYELKKANATVKEYLLPESGLKKYVGNFEYQGVYYQLIGTMDKADFEELLNKLYFL